MTDTELVILIGLQAAGKSTFRERYFDSTHVVVSKDRLRNHRRPARRQAQLVDEALKRGCSVVVDNTNPARSDRASLISLAHEHGATVCGYYLSSSIERSLERNRRRTGKAIVPDIAIFSTAKALERPSRSEGFDRLYYVENLYVENLEETGFLISDFIED